MKTFSRTPMLIGLVLMLGLLNIIVFLLPVERSSAFWAAYIFATLAFLFQIVFFELSFGSARNLKNIFFGFPVAYLGTIYLVLQLIFSAIVIFSEALEVQTTIIVSAILLTGTLFLLAAAWFTRDEITATEEKVLSKRRYTDTLYSDIEILQAKASEPEMKMVLKKLSDTVRYSDPMSAPELATLEAEIEAKVLALKAINLATGQAEVKELSKVITELLAERNSKTKLLK
jgi:hypothetical protein